MDDETKKAVMADLIFLSNLEKLHGVAPEVARQCRIIATRLDRVLVALYAAPGAGEAEPVAWRVVWFDGMREITEDADEAKRWQAKAGEDECSVEPLSAAPGAGEAGALRDVLAKLTTAADLFASAFSDSDYCDECLGCPVCDAFGDMEVVREARAALAPGGRPRCETCGGDGEIDYVRWSELRKELLNAGPPSKSRTMPCPACAPAAEGDADAR